MGNRQSGGHFARAPSTDDYYRTTQSSRDIREVDHIFYKRPVHPLRASVTSVPLVYADRNHPSVSRYATLGQEHHTSVVPFTPNSHTSFDGKYNSSIGSASSIFSCKSRCTSDSGCSNGSCGFPAPRNLGRPYNRVDRRSLDTNLNYRKKNGACSSCFVQCDTLDVRNGNPHTEHWPALTPIPSVNQSANFEQVLFSWNDKEIPRDHDENESHSKGSQVNPSSWIFIGGGLGRLMAIGRSGQYCGAECGKESKEIQTSDLGDVLRDVGSENFGRPCRKRSDVKVRFGESDVNEKAEPISGATADVQHTQFDVVDGNHPSTGSSQTDATERGTRKVQTENSKDKVVPLSKPKRKMTKKNSTSSVTTNESSDSTLPAEGKGRQPRKSSRVKVKNGESNKMKEEADSFTGNKVVMNDTPIVSENTWLTTVDENCPPPLLTSTSPCAEPDSQIATTDEPLGHNYGISIPIWLSSDTNLNEAKCGTSQPCDLPKVSLKLPSAIERGVQTPEEFINTKSISTKIPNKTSNTKLPTWPAKDIDLLPQNRNAISWKYGASIHDLYHDSPILMVNKQSVNKFKESISLSRKASKMSSINGTCSSLSDALSSQQEKRKSKREYTEYADRTKWSESKLKLEKLPQATAIKLQLERLPQVSAITTMQQLKDFICDGKRKILERRKSDYDNDNANYSVISSTKQSMVTMTGKETEYYASSSKRASCTKFKPSLKKTSSTIKQAFARKANELAVDDQMSADAPKRRRSIRFAGVPPSTP